jgi:hypothetical protein
MIAETPSLAGPAVRATGRERGTAEPRSSFFQGALDDLLEYIEAGFTDEALRAMAKRVERAR